MNNYNQIAWIYDPLKRLVFGNKLDSASTTFLNTIEVDQTVLIVGGGSGKILKGIPQSTNVIFLEKSHAMIKNAKRHMSSEIRFHCGDYLNFDFESKFDWIICPFFLDVFDKSDLDQAILKSHDLLKIDGRFLVSDFQKGNFFQNLLIRFMYGFFKITTNTQAARLQNIHGAILQNQFKEVSSRFFLSELVFSRIYTK